HSNRHIPFGFSYCVGGHAVDSEGGKVVEREVGRVERWKERAKVSAKKKLPDSDMILLLLHIFIRVQ
nr:hypothetical protein [Bacteroidota bacterium]